MNILSIFLGGDVNHVRQCAQIPEGAEYDEGFVYPLDRESNGSLEDRKSVYVEYLQKIRPNPLDDCTLKVSIYAPQPPSMEWLSALVIEPVTHLLGDDIKIQAHMPSNTGKLLTLDYNGTQFVPQYIFMEDLEGDEIKGYGVEGTPEMQIKAFRGESTLYAVCNMFLDSNPGLVTWLDHPPRSKGTMPLLFQHGPVGEDGLLNGVTNEGLLAIVKDRLEEFQKTEYACQENDEAISFITRAISALNKRTLRVMAERKALEEAEAVAEPLETEGLAAETLTAEQSV